MINRNFIPTPGTRIREIGEGCGKKPAHLGDIGKKDKISNSNDGLLVEHVKLLGDGCREEAAAKDGRASLGDQTGV